MPFVSSGEPEQHAGIHRCNDAAQVHVRQKYSKGDIIRLESDVLVGCYFQGGMLKIPAVAKNASKDERLHHQWYLLTPLNAHVV